MINTSIEEACEAIVIGALKGGTLAGLTFRQADDGDPSFTEGITVKAGAPEPRLQGERGFKVVVSIELKSAIPQTTDAWHEIALQRITNASIVLAAALAAGLSSAHDNLTILDEEIGGDRRNTKHTRKRTITVPFIFAYGS